MEKSTRQVIKLAWGFLMIAAGAIVNQLGLGSPDFSIYGSVGNFLIYIGFLALIVVLFSQLRRKDRKVDERMEFVAGKAMRITFLAFVVIAFAVIVIDGFVDISTPYYLSMSYLVSAMLMVYYVSYRMLLRNH